MKTLLFALFALFTLTAQAETISMGHLKEPLLVERLQVVRGEPGESKEMVVRRAAAIIDAFSRETGFEACGRIWVSQDGTAWGIPLTTNKAHTQCIATNAPVAGMILTEESLHSHPAEEVYRANDNDRIASAGRIKKGSALRIKLNDLFSDIDMRGPPGYLATKGRLFFKDSADRASIQDLGVI